MKNLLCKFKQKFDNGFAPWLIAFSFLIAFWFVSLFFAFPASAVEEPTEDDQVIIPAGTYRFNDVITALPYSVLQYPLNSTDSANFLLDYGFDIVPVPLEIGGESYTLTRLSVANIFGDQFENGVAISFNESIITNLGNISPSYFYGAAFTIPDDTSVNEITFNWLAANTDLSVPANAIITAGTYFGVDVPSPGSFNVSFSFTSDSYDFDTFYVGTDFITYRMLTGDVRSVNAFNFASDLWTINYETITVPTDQTLPADFVTWFNSNYTTQPTPDPEPTYTISAGYYKARDSFSTSGWNVSNDSIRIRYYNDAANVQAYQVVDGISFLVENDAAEIYYADMAVFTDGWNIDGAKNIQVMQDITVSSDFYTVFNNVYVPSSEGTNEFDSGYAAGYVDGRDAGYDIGYRQGYAQGFEDGDTNIFVDIIGGTLAAVDSFTIFGGFSLLDLISTLLGGMALVWILKLLAGG